jgi:hypothetical protein
MPIDLTEDSTDDEVIIMKPNATSRPKNKRPIDLISPKCDVTMKKRPASVVSPPENDILPITESKNTPIKKYAEGPPKSGVVNGKFRECNCAPTKRNGDPWFCYARTIVDPSNKECWKMFGSVFLRAG